MPDLPDPSSAPMLESNVPVEGTLWHDDSGHETWFRVTLTELMTVAFQVDTVVQNSQMECRFRLLDSAGNVVINTLTDDDYPFLVSYTPSTSGVFYLQISEAGWNGWPYFINADLSDSVAANITSTAMLSPISPVYGANEAGNDRDFYGFNVVAGVTYTFALKGEGDGAYDNKALQVVSDTGSVLTESRGLGSTTLTWVAIETGKVFINVSSSDPDFYMAVPSDYKLVVGVDMLGIAGTAGRDHIVGGAGTNKLSGFAGDDLLSGLLGNDTLSGGAGNDTLFGGGGDDLLVGGLGNDQLIGGGGRDTASFEGATAVRVDLRLTGLQNTGLGNDRLAGIENLTGSSAGDNLHGDQSVNLLIGLNGNDTLNGDSGNDRLNGGLGNDLIIGGTGVDTAVFDSGRNVSVSLKTTGVQNTGEGLDQLSGIENLTTGQGNDHLVGNSLANLLDGGAGHDLIEGGIGNDILIGSRGNDTLDGGAQFDTVDYSGNIAVRVNLSLSEAQQTGLGIHVIRNVENVQGSSLNDVIDGNAGANRLIGGEGSDILSGRDGKDILRGGAGSDILLGGVGADQLTGGAGPDRFVFQLGAGADVVTDFSRADDVIVIKSGAASFDDLTITQFGSDSARVEFGGVLITLLHINAYDLDSSDFIFG